MTDDLVRLKEAALQELEGLHAEADVLLFKSRYIGRNGELTRLIRGLRQTPADQRAARGKVLNDVKNELEQSIEKALLAARAAARKQVADLRDIDVTLPGRKPHSGHRHPVTQVADRIIAIFVGMGFQVVQGPEVELDFFNFEALNIPRDHPARDMHDTFYISDEQLLRTHTSPVQIRTMQHASPPLKIICPGKVYRCDSDISHTPMFHQIEGLLVDEHITFGDLKGVLSILIHNVFDQHTAIRFRPSFFPFTEPSAEVDIQCVMCGGRGCRVCSGTGWIEILGSGIVHPAVFRNVGYDPEKVSGFAFGLGIERIAMLMFGINDIRLFYENDYRFLSQF